MSEGDIVDLKTDSRWRGGTVREIKHERAYVSWPENEDNGESSYAAHLISNLVFAEMQLTIF